MNCVEFRRQLGVDPHSSGAEFVRHRADCVRCADAAARAMDFDRDLDDPSRRAIFDSPCPRYAKCDN